MKKLLIALLALAMTGCSSEPSKPAEKPQPKLPEYVTGRTAFQKLYVAAHGWGRDAQPYRLESINVGDSKGKDGKASVWRASFGSAVQRGIKPYVWSGIDAPDVPARGISPGNEDTYNPSNSSTHVFDIAFLKIDSDKALEVSLKHGGDKILEKTPATSIAYICDWNTTTHELTWHVIYGNSKDDYVLKVAVNASSGDFIRVEK